ncbi:hypothetical protein [Dyadobacter crusticola]|uniref:hypothetical protein n=1 Tax=Dyadobacter crusticola TaxID=292407 RepID=UPI0004E0E8DE|nr:hypothetical protein [Dyadobacter crusticola]
MHADILEIKSIYYFSFLSLITVLLAYFTQKELLTNSVYYNTYSEIMSAERIETIIENTKNYSGLIYATLPLIILIKTSYNTFFVTTATLLDNSRSYNFLSNFNICLKAEGVFVIMQLVKVYFLSFLKEADTLTDVQTIPLSAITLFEPKSIPLWSVYIFQTLNVWEVLFCYIGTWLFAKNYQVPMKTAFVLFCVPYLIGVLVLIFLSVFITIITT